LPRIYLLFRFEKELKEKLLQKSNAKLTEEACLIKMFKYFDIYDKGEVSLPEFMKAMEKIGLYYNLQEMTPLFNQYDADRSGKLDYKEFSCIVFGGENPKGQMAKK
jgi:Ca2+-binding EF-hand superfamily protein